jgi:acyl-CoA synthetase (AMP-forming)/AMP-acid ligase II
MFLGDIVRQNAMKFPNKTAVICGDTRLTYLELNNQANRLANALLNLGVKKGDRVAVLADTCPEYVIIYFACAKTDTVIVPINATLGSSGVSSIIASSGASTIIFGEEYADTVNSIRPEMSTLKRNIVIGEMTDVHSFEKAIKGHSADEPDVIVDEDDIAWLCYTSGTTGVPKGVMLSHKNIISNVKDTILSGYPNGRNEINLSLLPMSHPAGMAQPLLHYIVGGTNVLMKKYSPVLFLEITQKERVTTTIMVSPMLASIIGVPDVGRYDVSSLRLALVGGALIPAGQAGKFTEIFGDIILPIYGMAEASSLIITAPLLEGTLSAIKRPGSSGKELVNVEVRLVNEEGDDVAPGEVGEVLVASDSIMEGYWEMPEETARALEGGYLHTGDLASRDEEGYYYITGRKKDIIFTSGKEVLSPEIENVISLHPAVSEMAVIGVPDEKLGEMVKAFITLKRGEKATEQDIIEWCARYLEDYKVPKMVGFIDTLPKTASGKVQKSALEKQK